MLVYSFRFLALNEILRNFNNRFLDGHSLYNAHGLGVENRDEHDIMPAGFQLTGKRGDWIEVAWYANT
jgi:hypothetical protein